MTKEIKSATFWRDVIAEFLATFLLMTVQSAIVMDWGKDDPAKSIRVGLALGFIVATMAWALGDFGGGHINPAVTVAMVFGGCCTILRGILYVIAQCVGAIAGAGFIYAVTPADFRGNLALTDLNEGMEPWQGYLVETWVTCILVLTILGATNERRKGNVYMPTILIGFAVCLGIMSAFNHTGGSLNPARSFGPAVVINKWNNHWVYWAGPCSGGILASLLYSYMLDRVDRGKKEESYDMRGGQDNDGADFGEDKF
ncbi:hypothetical protein CAPTEDRAFT_180401 [Capitella teleta]|uniref:Aquaporin n=1 Tax=Capitella teleta TaxID=283909 RepID=R7UHU3_CAPTE|nr:hypothetical protein CAPTEDRAFT_180401 [Capitella teleta]|eukprot:ELU02847.1 hypothetical protein CAPTEDRAFT_180401 [Capitella teleta]